MRGRTCWTETDNNDLTHFIDQKISTLSAAHFESLPVYLRDKQRELTDLLVCHWLVPSPNSLINRQMALEQGG